MNTRPVQSLIGLTMAACFMTACGGTSFKNKESYGATAVSFTGDRLVGVMEKFQGACDTDDSWHPVQWCGDYDNVGFVKDHAFKLWTHSENLSTTLTTVSEPTAGGNDVQGQFSDYLEGKVMGIQYVHNSNHHYVLVSARILNFVEVGAAVTSGEFVVYKISLSENGTVNSVVDVARQPVSGCTVEDQSIPTSQMSSDGSIISVASNSGNCLAGESTVIFYDANTLNTLYTIQADSWGGEWVIVEDGASDEQLLATSSASIYSWDFDEGGSPSLANPTYYNATVDFVEAREIAENAALQSRVYVFRNSMGPGVTTQVRFLSDANIEERVLETERYFVQPNSQRALIFDYENKQYRSRGFTFGTSVYVQDEIPLSGDFSSNYLFEDDPSRGLYANELRLDITQNNGSDFVHVEGMLVRYSYAYTEVLSPRDFVMRLSFIETVDDVVDEYNFTTKQVFEGSEFSSREYGRIAWTFSEAGEMYSCLVETATETVARNTVISENNLSTGCNGNGWLKMMADY